MRSLREESGQALAVVVLSLTMLLGFVGLAVDMGSLLHNKRELQVAADAAAVAGAMHANYPDLVAAAKNASAANGFTDGSNNVTVTINTPPTAGNYASQTGYVEAIVQQNEPTIFMGLFKHGTMPVLARAVAVYSAGGSGAGCIFTLGQTGTDFSLGGNVNFQGPNCGLYVDSNSTSSKTPAMSVNGNIVLNMASIGVVGNYVAKGNVSVTPSSPTLGITPYSDPLSYIPGYSCTANSCTPSTGGSSISCTSLSLSGNVTKTLSPGCYTGLSASGNYNLTFNPGVYIINGSSGISFGGNGNLSGTGVTFYLAQGGIDIAGNVSMNLSAPTSGTYNGILFDQSPSDSSSAEIDGNAGSVLKGVMYFPNASLTMNGNSGSKVYADFVVSSLSLQGNASFYDYASLGGSVTSPIANVNLVE